MTNSVRNSDRPMITELGGMSCDVTARRTNDSTMTMRVKPVTLTNTAGTSTSAPRNRAVCSGGDRFWYALDCTTCSTNFAVSAIAHLRKLTGR